MNNKIPEEYRKECAYIAERLGIMFIYTGNYDEGYIDEIRNAALIAIHALNWLSEPAETVEIVTKKRPFISPEYPKKE